MHNEKDMKEVVKTIKQIIKPFLGDKEVTNIDVAAALDLGSEHIITSWIDRDAIPYEFIIKWCYRTGVDPMEIFFKKENK